MNLDEFEAPDLSDAGFFPERYLEGAPSDGRMKGVLFNDLERLVGPGQLGASARERYVAFKDYSTAEWCRVLHDAAKRAYPRMATRAALHRLGLRAYEAFGASTAGRVMFAMTGRDLGAIYRMAPRIVGMVHRGPVLEIESLGEGLMVLRARNIWDFPDCYSIGVWRSPAVSFGERCEVRIRRYSICDMDYLLDFR
ncbi:MAG: DUF2378 family protein [Myxococcota bacterium]